MIEADKRKAIFLLHQEGMPLREIARRLHVSRNTVAVVIAQGGQLPKLVRSPKQKIDSQLLQSLYEQCDGWIQRMHEKLAEEQGIEVKYSTLTRMLRQLGISKSQQSRCSQVPDEPGAEMQHDTTLYRLKLGEQPQKVVATVLYLAGLLPITSSTSVGKTPDATAPGNARIVPRLFTSALGGGLSAWAHATRGDSEARLRRLLLGTRKIPFAVAPAKSRDPKGSLRVPRRAAT